MKKLVGVFVCLAVVGFGWSAAQAAGAQVQKASGAAMGCYSPREAEAEQGIRIHSELMVIGLNCSFMKDSKGNNLYAEHRKFTAKYADLFAAYEKILMSYMARNGDKNPESSLNTLRTSFANKISTDAAHMRPDIFCRQYAPRIEQVVKMDKMQLRKWAATPFPGHPVSKPYCASAQGKQG
ncbi:MAG: hypothetical protein KDI13_03095 [Alphaproteobacteria bacterium]|nr:hypothetical protein [Alphaproteobacteria bacterium]